MGCLPPTGDSDFAGPSTIALFFHTCVVRILWIGHGQDQKRRISAIYPGWLCFWTLIGVREKKHQTMGICVWIYLVNDGWWISSGIILIFIWDYHNSLEEFRSQPTSTNGRRVLNTALIFGFVWKYVSPKSSDSSSSIEMVIWDTQNHIVVDNKSNRSPELCCLIPLNTIHWFS